jgi:hypothetical protein
MKSLSFTQHKSDVYKVYLERIKRKMALEKKNKLAQTQLAL